MIETDPLVVGPGFILFQYRAGLQPSLEPDDRCLLDDAVLIVQDLGMK